MRIFKLHPYLIVLILATSGCGPVSGHLFKKEYIKESIRNNTNGDINIFIEGTSKPDKYSNYSVKASVGYDKIPNSILAYKKFFSYIKDKEDRNLYLDGGASKIDITNYSLSHKIISSSSIGFGSFPFYKYVENGDIYVRFDFDDVDGRFLTVIRLTAEINWPSVSVSFAKGNELNIDFNKIKTPRLYSKDRFRVLPASMFEEIYSDDILSYSVGHSDKNITLKFLDKPALLIDDRNSLSYIVDSDTNYIGVLLLLDDTFNQHGYSGLRLLFNDNDTDGFNSRIKSNLSFSISTNREISNSDFSCDEIYCKRVLSVSGPVNFYESHRAYKYSKPARSILAPFSIAFDIATAPIWILTLMFLITDR